MKKQTNVRYYLLLALVLALALFGFVYYGARKQGFHVDELYTYELANFPGGFYALQDGYMNTWHDGAFFDDALTTTADRAFDYGIPWNNQKIDVHPPLYYCAIYTVSSLLPGVVSKWVGLVPNFVFLLAAGLAMAAAARRLTGSRGAAVLCTAAYLLSVGVQGMAVFTRMYSLLMLEGLLLVLAHTVLFQRLRAGRGGGAAYAALACATFLGILTQYFYLVFCFFLCGLFALWLLGTRRRRALAVYCAAEFGALAAAYLAWPTMKTHIFSGSRGQEAFTGFFDLSALTDWAASLGRVARMIGGQFGGLWLWLAVLAAAALLLLRRGARPGGGLAALWLGAASVCYCIVIDKVAPFEADRYYVLVYAPLVLAAGTLLAALLRPRPRLRRLAPLLLLPVLAAHLTVGVSYLYEEEGARRAAELAETAALPAVVVNDAGYEVAPDLFLMEFAAREAVYQCAGDDVEAELADALASRDLGGGFVVYGYLSDADALAAQIAAVCPGASLTLLTETDRCPVYLVKTAS